MKGFVFGPPDLQDSCKYLSHREEIDENIFKEKEPFKKSKEEKKEKEHKSIEPWKCCYHGTWIGNCRKCIMYTLIWIGKQRKELKLVKDLYKTIYNLLPRVKRIYCSRCCVNSTIRSFRTYDGNGYIYSGPIVPLSSYLFRNKVASVEKAENKKVYLMGQFNDEYLVEDVSKFDDIECYFIKRIVEYTTDNHGLNVMYKYLSWEEVKKKYFPTQSMKNIVVCDDCMFEMLHNGEITTT